jgi:hypothetical protein
LAGAPALRATGEQPQLATVEGERTHLDECLIPGRGRVVDFPDLCRILAVGRIDHSEHLMCLLSDLESPR